ncbi:MAG: ABC transporter substrate-binding protein [Betaproteobacteria bacterium]|jgi:peptide/nickel transport system substrate-binding protein|nr:ABC transporter substrate-binding protein [Betaproteobacteria bacterium]
MRRPQRALCAALAFAALAFAPLASANEEPPMLKEAVAAGKLPPMAQRLPEKPLVVPLGEMKRESGRYGGDMRMVMARDRDIRMMVVFGYARLVAYDLKLQFVPDIVESFENAGDREFTFRLRPGHRWSDGHPFTSEDFRYYWEDVANNKALSPIGLPQALLADGKGPKVSFPDPLTVRYVWESPNPLFLPAIAGPSPLFLYRPAHYLRKFHARYLGEEEAKAQAAKAKARNWAGLHHKKDEQYRFDNPDLPTLEPWVNMTAPPATRFVFHRNPYFHRVDPSGRQLPYIDRVVMGIADEKLVPAKTGAGEADLQARYLRFDDYTFLKKNEKRSGYEVRLWDTVKGSQIALHPNLNVEDPAWRKLMRDVRFRRALSLAVNRHEINQVVFFGLVQPSNNTVLPASPLYEPAFRAAWTRYDLKAANALLDEIGLTTRDANGLRLLPDGRPLEIVVDTAGESTEETDVLELIRDSWRQVGIALYSRPSQREIFRKRVFSGQSMMSVWSGLDNGLATADMSPEALAPVKQEQLQWPMWGNHVESRGKGGSPPDIPEAKELLALYEGWQKAPDSAERTKIWKRMLSIHAEQQFIIGTVTGNLQPVVVSRAMRNVPAKGLYNWDPGAYFGIHRPDTFWIDRGTN